MDFQGENFYQKVLKLLNIRKTDWRFLSGAGSQASKASVYHLKALEANSYPTHIIQNLPHIWNILHQVDPDFKHQRLAIHCCINVSFETKACFTSRTHIYESPFLWWNHKNKIYNCDFLAHNSEFMSCNSMFISQLYILFYEFWVYNFFVSVME